MPQQAVEMLYQETKGEALITTGVGQHQMWAAQFYKFDKPRHWVTSGGLGTMGFGLPSGNEMRNCLNLCTHNLSTPYCLKVGHSTARPLGMIVLI